jgi:hypothetical protein
VKPKTKPDLTLLGTTPIQRAERIAFLLALIVLALDLLIWRP